MMNSFESACEIEASERGKIEELVMACSLRGHIAIDGVNMTAMHLQTLKGDYLISQELNGKPITLALEVKVDTTRYGNFFLEEWSNKKFQTPGWMQTSQADLLWYFFANDGAILYSIWFPGLKIWAYGNKPNLYKYAEKVQRTRQQMNDTWGRCVPRSTLERELKPLRQIAMVDMGTDQSIDYKSALALSVIPGFQIKRKLEAKRD
jgi:hypothetical protein